MQSASSFPSITAKTLTAITYNFFIVALITALTFTATLQAQDNQTAESDTTQTGKVDNDIHDKLIMERIMVVGAPAWKDQLPGAASYVDSEQLQKHGYTDINRVLRHVSGVNLQEEDGFGLRPNIGLRGAGVERSSKVNLMEDGVLIAPAPYSAPAAYYFPNVARMEAVEVRKGSSQIKYGPNTTGGVINLISAPIPFELSGKAEASLGEYNANKLYASIGNSYENVGFVLEGMQLRNDGFKKLDGGGNTGFNIKDFMGKFMVRTNPGASVFQRLELKAGYYDELSDETYLGLTRQDFNENPFRRYAGSQADRMDAQHRHLMARHFAQFSPNLDATTTLYRNDFKRDWYKLQSVDDTGIATVVQNPDSHSRSMGYLRGVTSPDGALVARSNNREYYSQGIESKLVYILETGDVQHDLALGVRLHRDEEDRFQYEDGYRMENGTMILTDGGTPGKQANRIGSATAVSFYLQNKLRYGAWTVSPGLRYETIGFANRNYGKDDLQRTGSHLSLTEYRVHVLVPGLGITREMSERLTLIAGVHKGFSPPSPGSGSETRSEESINYEAGLRYADELIQGEIIGFFNDYHNLLGSDLEAGGGGGTTAQFNAGEVRVFGAEFSTNLDLAEAGLFDVSFLLPFSVNYTFTEATFQSSFNSQFTPWGEVAKGDILPFIPKHQLNAGLSLIYERVHLHLNATATGQMRTRAASGSIPEEFSTDRYFLMDVSSAYDITTAVSVFVNLRNILDHTYIVSDRPAGVRPGLPRTLMGGVRYTL